MDPRLTERRARQATPARGYSLPVGDDASFAALARLVQARSGINLTRGKEMLVISRLTRRMNELRMKHLAELVEYLHTPLGSEELPRVIDALSTNVTEFFRHERHFEIVGDTVRRAIRMGKRRFRFWSAACSSGEEPYSLAMSALDAAGDTEIDLVILATDISTRVLARATRGEYSRGDLVGLPEGFEQRYFEPGSAAGAVRVSQRIRRAVRFRHFNLSGPALPLAGKLNLIFCRNVMIYFDRALRQRLVDDASQMLERGGLFFVGQSESLAGIDNPSLTSVEPSVFVRR